MLRTCLIHLVLLATPALAVAGDPLDPGNTLEVPGQFATIQEALDAAQPKDQVHVAPGSYPEIVMLVGRTDLGLYATGKVIIDGLRISACDGIWVRGITIHGTEGDAVWISGTENAALQRCEVTQAPGNAVRIDDCGFVRVDRFRLAGMGESGIAVSNCPYLEITRNVITGAPVAGVDVWFDPTGLEPWANLYRNRIVEAGVVALRVQNGSSTVAIDSNQVVRPAAAGLAILGSIDGPRAWGNTIVRPGTVGLFVSTPGIRAIGNRIRQPGTVGIHVTGDDGLYQANRVRGAGQFGIEVSGTGNHFEDNVTRRSVQQGLVDTQPGNTYDENDFDSASFPAEG